MGKIKQHIPPFVSGAQRKEAEFNSLEDLLAIEWVSSFKDEPYFHRYSFSEITTTDDGETTRLLMAEYKEGFEWWVVGMLDGKVDLPEWEPKHRQTGDLIIELNSERDGSTTD